MNANPLGSQLRWTMPLSVTFSVAVHVVCALALGIAMTRTKEIVPIGIEMIYQGEAPEPVPPAAKAPKKIARAKEDIAADEPANVKVAELPEAAVEGGDGARGPTGAIDGQAVSAIERYKFELRLFLESRKIYPETAKRLRQVGTVVVQFTVNPEGDLGEVNIERPSGSEILNRSALELVKSAKRFKPMPTEARLSQLKLTLPIEYVL